MGKNSFGVKEGIAAFILAIYLLYLLIKVVIWIVSTIYKKLSESSNKTEPSFHQKEYQSYTRGFNFNHSKNKRKHHKTHYYKTQRNDRSEKEHYQKTDPREKALRILNLKGTESEEEIKRAYRKAVKKWHPDNNKDWCAEKRFIEIHEAYKLLLNLKKTGAI